MGGKSKSTTVGYHYRPAFHVGLVGRQIDAFLEYRAADKTAWAGELTASGRIQIDAPDLFGGEKDQGGIVGPVDLMFGEPDQMPNPYLLEEFGSQTVAWRGMTSLVFAGGRFGAMNPYQQKSAYKIRKILRGWDGGGWYPERAQVMILPGQILTPDLSFPATSASIGPYAGVTFSEGFSANDTIVVEKPAGLTYQAWSYWATDSNPAAGGRPWTNAFWVTDASDNTSMFWGGELDSNGAASERYATLAAAEAAVSGRFVSLTGSTSYTFWLYDEPVTDNRGGLSLRVYRGGLFGINPAHALYYIRTDPEKGGEPRANVNEGSLKAAADKLHDEGFGLCQVVFDPQQDTPDSVTERICRIIGGSFERSLVDGQWYLDLARGDYDVESLPVMGDDDILEFRKQPTTLHGVTNSLSVRYFDPQRKESIITPAVRALGLIRTFGEIHETLDFAEIPTADLALRVAERELRARITPSQTFEIVTRPRLIGLRRNQYFRIQSPKRGIADMVCIVGERDAGTLRSGALRWKVVQDIYSLPATTYVEVEPGVDVRPPQVPGVIEHARAFEAPYIDVVGSLPRAELEALPSDVGFLLAVAARPGHGLDYTMMVKPEGGDFEAVATGEWCPTAIAVEAIELGPGPAVVPLAEVRGLDRIPIGAAVMIGTEILRLDAKHLDPPQVTLARGCSDTVPKAHAAGSRLWFLGDDMAADVTEYAAGESVEVKLLPRTGSQQLPLANAPTIHMEFEQRAARPYPPANVQLDGAYAPAAEVESPFDVTWAYRDRVLQADQLLDWYAGSVGPEPGTTFIARFYQDATDTLLLETDPTADDSETVTLEYTGWVRMELVSLRDSLECWQPVVVRFLHVEDDIGPLQISGTLPAAEIGVTYEAALDVTGAVGSVTYSIVAGELPPGIEIDHGASDATQVVFKGMPEEEE